MRASPSAVELKYLFNFDGSDGKTPAAGLADVDGILYGTTYGGGATDAGTVFKITPSGTQRVLHSFKGGKDGALPGRVYSTYGECCTARRSMAAVPAMKASFSRSHAPVRRASSTDSRAARTAQIHMRGLTDVDGRALRHDRRRRHAFKGTVFKITPPGKERVLYSFGAGFDDGSTPASGLIDVNGALYGTTSYGGGNCGSYGCGTVFEVTTTGAETPLYGFKGGKDGSTPAAALVNVERHALRHHRFGRSENDGTVFKITTSGEETVLYSFKGGRDGAVPQKLIVRSGRSTARPPQAARATTEPSSRSRRG